jgi:large subunit ribosomal protein L23
MTLKDPYQIVKHLHVTEKAKMLRELKDSESNPSVRRCQSPKEVFVVHPKATKRDIRDAVEAIYKDRQVKVVSVNTIHVKGKVKRRRGRIGTSPSFKKAIVTLAAGDSLYDV